MHRPKYVLVALALAACDDGGPARDAADPPDAGEAADAAPPGDTPDATPPDATPPIGWCEGATRFVYDPTAGDRLYAFPDDYYTEPAETPTGLRVRLDETTAPWLAETPEALARLYAALNALDGWGTAAPVSLRFDGPLPPFAAGEPAGLEGGIALYDLGSETPARVPVEVRAFDEGRRVFLWPLVPLRPGTPHAAVVTRDFAAADGGCIAPGETLRALLAGEAPADERLSRLAPRFAALPARLGLAPGDVSAAVLFTTQTVVDESVAIAADIAGRTFDWSRPPDCRPNGEVVACEGAFVAGDYRTDGVVTGSTPVDTYELTVSIWLPRDDGAPWPTLVLGHGLGGDRRLGGTFARLMRGQGVAIVAIDAVGHGDHPTAVSPGALQVLTDFFAIDIARRTIDVRRMRDNWRQSTYDKLQLLALIRARPDVDGDGAPDLDPARLEYFGASLGGLMGPELLALSDDFGAAVLAMAGGRLSRVVAESGQFSSLVRTMVPPRTPPDEIEQLLAVFQTGVERGDPFNYGPYVLSRRLPGADARTPNLLFTVAIDDEIVPNGASWDLARALGVPVVPPVLVPLPLVPEAPRAPVRGNVAGGAATAGLFQYDVVVPWFGGDPEPASHENLVIGQHTVYQLLQFHRTWLADGVATIVDPFDHLPDP